MMAGEMTIDLYTKDTKDTKYTKYTKTTQATGDVR